MSPTNTVCCRLRGAACCRLSILTRGDCRTSGVGAEGRGQHPGNENKLCSSDNYNNYNYSTLNATMCADKLYRRRLEQKYPSFSLVGVNVIDKEMEANGG